MFKNTPYVKRYYRIGLLLTSIIVINFVTLIYITSSFDTVDRVLGVGKQRTLSQKIAYTSLAIIEEPDPQGKADLSQVLLNSINEIGAEVLTFSQRELPPDIRSLYFEPPFNLDSVIQAYLTAAKNIATNYKTITVDNLDYVYIKSNADKILTNLNLVVSDFQQYSRDRDSMLSTVKIVLLTISVWLLLFEAIFIFTPMGEAVMNREKHLESKIDQHVYIESLLNERLLVKRLILAHLPRLAIMFFDKNMKFLVVEGEFLNRAGYDPKELVGKYLKDTVPSDRYEFFLPYYKKALVGLVTSFESVTRKGIPYRSEFVPVYDQYENIVGGMVISEDLSEIKKEKKKLIDG